MTVFEITPEILQSLGQKDSVAFLRMLLWCEGARVGIGRNLIDVPSCVNVGDGGLDAVINNANPSSEDVIPQGFSGFQVKASDLIPSKCKKDLHQDKKILYPLQLKISRLMDQNGTYILVLFKDITSRQRRDRKEAIITY